MGKDHEVTCLKVCRWYLSKPLHISDGVLRSEKILEHDKIEESTGMLFFGVWGKSLRSPKQLPLWAFSPIWIYRHKWRQLEVIRKMEECSGKRVFEGKRDLGRDNIRKQGVKCLPSWLLTPSRNNCPFFPGEDCVLWLRMGDYMPVSPGEGKSLLPECHGFGEELLPSYQSGPSIFPYLGKSILCLHSSKGLERCHLEMIGLLLP